MIVHNSDPHTRLFNALSEVRMMSCVLSELIILCSSLVKPYYTKMTIHPLFTVHTLRPFHAFSNLLDFIGRTDPYIKTFSTLHGVRIVFLFYCS